MKSQKLLALIGLAALAAVGLAAGCRRPNLPPPDVFTCSNFPSLAPDLPGDVDLPRHPEALCFAWKQFIALNWPAAAGSAGQPDRRRTSRSFGEPRDTTPTVWETYKEAHEVFLPDGSRPRPWGVSGLGASLPATFRLARARTAVPLEQLDQASGIQVLRMTTKISAAAAHLSRDEQAAGGRLIAQNGKLTYYGIHVNREEFEYILSNGFYEASQQATRDIVLPVGSTGRGPGGSPAEGSIEVKSAWVELTDRKSARRFRTIEACIVEGDGCRMATVGLVGLHIIHKTETFPQWSWSTFEHVDNAPDREDVRQGRLRRRYTYFDPRCTTCTPNPPPATGSTAPVQVVRQTPIAANVALLNRRMEETIRRANRNSVWRYYQLVDIQWPEAAEPSISPRVVPLPLGGPTPTSIANATLETYVQHTTCLNCHRNARIACSSAATGSTRAADYSFVFSMAKEATPSPGCR